MSEDFLDKLATFALYLSALVILVWAILKSVGVLHSPVWVEMIPYYGVAVAISGGVYKLGKLMQKIDSALEKIEDIPKLSEKLVRLETRCDERHYKRKR